MPDVSVTVNGRKFRLGCDDGQEDHLMNLARDLNSRIEGLRKEYGEVGDARLAVLAALKIADALAETCLRIKRLEEELAALQAARMDAADRHEAALNAAAERIETIAKKLNQPTGGIVALG